MRAESLMANTWGNLNAEERKMMGERIETASPRVQSRFVSQLGLPAYQPLYRYAEMVTGSDTAFREAQGAIPLIPPDEFDYDPVVTARDDEMAASIEIRVRPALDRMRAVAPMELLKAENAAATMLPATVDHRGRQSPVKNQQNRGTCVSHASMGALEAFSHMPQDLSEQYAHYKFTEFEGRSQYDEAGIRTTDAAVYLAKPEGRVCLETEWPYIGDQQGIRTLIDTSNYQPPSMAISNQQYGISAYKIVPDLGLSNESIKNAYLETLLASGMKLFSGPGFPGMTPMTMASWSRC
ncbi:MAG: hypothetical protein WKF37_05990 [Bryobacteraceae bacterium]